MAKDLEIMQSVITIAKKRFLIKCVLNQHAA